MELSDEELLDEDSSGGGVSDEELSEVELSDGWGPGESLSDDELSELMVVSS